MKMLVEFEYLGDICSSLEGRFATRQDSLYLHTKAEELKGSGYIKILVDFGRVALHRLDQHRVSDRDLHRREEKPAGPVRFSQRQPAGAGSAGADAAGASVQIYPNEAAALEALGAGKTSASQAS